MTTFVCSSIEELSSALAESHRARRKMPLVDLSRLNRVVDHAPDDMTVTVQGGLALAALEDRLQEHGQWLPLDPPFFNTISIEQLLSDNLSGPRRHGYGTAREHLIGLTVVVADGRVIHSGGKVVKNVAGYDMAKLFVGARRTLGIPVEATFKLMPRPEMECLVQHACDSLQRASELLEAIVASPLTPVAMDLHGGDDSGQCVLTLGFEGNVEDVVWQKEEASQLGVTQPADWSRELDFWNAGSGKQPRRLSVAPSRLMETLAGISDSLWLARAGQGLIFHLSADPNHTPDLPVSLMQRLKSSFDPHRILPEIPW